MLKREKPKPANQETTLKMLNFGSKILVNAINHAAKAWSQPLTERWGKKFFPKAISIFSHFNHKSLNIFFLFWLTDCMRQKITLMI